MKVAAASISKTGANRDIEIELPSPIFDTPDANQAIRRPTGLLSDYSRRSQCVWLSATAKGEADRVIRHLGHQGGPTWTTLIGPFGFGKSATLTAMWQYFDTIGVLATPPISVTSLDSLLDACATILGERAGTRRELVQAACSKARGGRGSGRRVRNGADALVEFLRLLCGPDGPFRDGVVICIDELQQLLGPLDSAALQDLRSLVWGLRTERVNCGLLLTLDPILERRLARWASDILHRIADGGQRLDLRKAYDADFVVWLWARWGDNLRVTGGKTLDPDLAIALGQYVEREDLANGPRTVVEVFSRVIQASRGSYGVAQFVRDLQLGQFRFFSGTLNARLLVSSILDDAWVNESQERREFVEILGGFPNGAPPAILERTLSLGGDWQRVRRELFGPLLVNAGQGPALEALQRVRRKSWELDELVLRCWETLPALDSLMTHAPRLLSCTLIPWWFGDHPEACGSWRLLCGRDSADQLLEGEFDPEFPDRRIQIQVCRRSEPVVSSDDADLVVRFLLDEQGFSECGLEVPNDPSLPIFLELKVALLSPIEELPAALQRYRKFLDPEPIRPIHLLAALAELREQHDGVKVSERVRQRVDAFSREVSDLLGSVLLHGDLAIGRAKTLSLYGVRLIRAQATRGFRHRFPDYRPLRRVPRWRNELARYRRALEAADLRREVRMGLVPVEGTKVDVLRRLEQQSVAAGDSLVRSLEGLLRTEGSKESYRMWFSLHNLEQWTLQQLERSELPRMSLVDLLRRHGCSPAEAEEVVSLLLARKAIQEQTNGLLTPCVLEAGSAEPPASGAPAPVVSEPDPAEHALGNIDKRLIEVTARLRALETLELPPAGPLSKHVEAHVRDIVQRIDGTLGKARKLRVRCAGDNVASMLGELERRADEVERMTTRIVENHAYSQKWLHAATLLAGLERRLTLLREHRSGGLADARKDLDACIRVWRERFATDSEATLPRSGQLLDEVLGIERRVDVHLLEQRVAFDRRRRFMVEVFGWAAPEPAPWGLDSDAPTPFETLDRWVLLAAGRALSRLESAYKPGSWKDPTESKVTFRELHRRFSRAFEQAQIDGAAIDTLVSLGRRLRDGFRRTYELERIYNDPDAGPDFEELARVFASGEIELVVRERGAESES